MVFLTSLQSIIPIVLLISLGYFLKGQGMFNPTFSGNLSRFIMSVILPAGVFVSVLHHLHMSDLWDLRYGLLVVGLTYAIAYIVAFIMMKLLKVPKGIALFGPEALPYFLLYYIGNTISVWLVGVFLIELDPLPTVENGLANDECNRVRDSSSVQSTTAKKPKFDWRKLLPPPLIGFIVALIFLYFEIPLAPILHNTLNYLGDMVTPLSLIYIGIVLHDAGLKSMSLNKDAIGGIVGRFVISPIIMFCVIMGLQYGAGIVLEPIAIITFVVQSAGPVIAVLPIVANEAKSDLPFATGLVMISTILFVVVIPIIMEILTKIGITA